MDYVGNSFMPYNAPLGGQAQVESPRMQPLGASADNSMALKGAPPSAQADPLSGFEKLAQIRQMNNQNQLFQQEFQAKQALGLAAQQAIGPDGTFDTDRYLQNVANNPAAAYAAPEAAQQALQRRLTQAQTINQELDAHLKTVNIAQQKMGAINQTLGGLMSMQNPTRQDVMDRAADLVGTGLVDSKFVAGYLADMPQDGPQLRDWLRTHQMTAMSGKEQADTLAGQIVQTMAGNHATISNINGYLGTARPMATLGIGMSPGEAATPVQGPMNAQGQPTMRLKGATAPRTPGDQFLNPGNALAPQPSSGNPLAPSGGVAPSNSPTVQPMGTTKPSSSVAAGIQGRSPQGEAPAPKAAPTTPVQQEQLGNFGAKSSGGAGFAVGMSPSQQAYQEAAGKDVADYKKNLDDRVANEANLATNIQEVRQQLNKTYTGGGADYFQSLAQAAQALGMSQNVVDALAGGNLAASQIVGKVSVQDAMQQLKSQLTGVGGSRMNAQEFVTFVRQNPNLLTDPRAANEIFDLWNKFYDRDKAEQAAFANYKGDPTKWTSVWNNTPYMKHFSPATIIGGHYSPPPQSQGGPAQGVLGVAKGVYNAITGKGGASPQQPQQRPSLDDIFGGGK